MLPWLVSLSFEVNYIDLWRDLDKNAPGQIDYCMNLGPNNFLSLTNNQNSPGSGTRAYFRIYDSDGVLPKPWHQLTSSNRIFNQVVGKKIWENVTEGWRIEFDTHKISDNGALEPHYYITNNDQQDFRFDLFIYTPINFGSKGMKAELKLIENGDVVHLDGGDRNMYFHIKKTSWAMHNQAYDYFGDVDKIYMGPTINDDELLIKTQEKDANYTPPNGEETALGFTWYKHLLKSGDTNRFGFKIHPTADFERLPLIKDVTPLHEAYPDPYNVTFNVTSFNNKTVRVGWSRIQYREKTWCKETFTPRNAITGSINCSIPFGDSNVSKFYAVAEEIDDNGHKLLRGWEMFSPITRHKFGSLRPVLNLNTEPKESYDATDNFIYIDGYVDDENFVQFYYQYDGYNITKGEQLSTAAEFQQLHFQTSIPIPSTLPLGRNHTIKIWVEDDQGLLSKVYNKSFKYGDAGKPFTRNVYLSDERLIQNSETIQIVVYGDGVYTADKKTAKVYLQVDNAEPKEIATFTSSNYPEPFAGIYTFTPGSAAHHTFKVFAREEDDTTSNPEKFATTTLIVWDPNASQPSINIGKFVDKSSAIGSPAKALFNLHYIDIINEQEWNMTYNDEGFYCKFRTFNDSFTTSPINEYNLVHTPNGITTADDFIIRFSIATDPGTNFTLAKFNVKNNRYFERKFQLSVLSDSELADSEDTITYDRTSGKIVVNSTKQYLSYTVFTHGFNGSPTPNNIFVQPSGRSQDGSINPEGFWKNYQQNKPTAYGMSWTETVIPGKGSLEYTITFAAFGNVKSPTRLVDKTEWKDTYKSDSTADKIKIIFEDYDGNENITLKVTENGGMEQSYPWTVSDPFNPTMNFTNARESVYTVSVQAFDKDPMTRYPSNKIEKTIYLKEKPQLSLTEPTKEFYSNRDDYVIEGNITGPVTLKEADICYRHYLHRPDDKWSPSAERCTMKGTKVGTPFSMRIKMDDIWPLSDDKWKIQIYAKDGELKSIDQNFTFNLNPYNPPTLKKAGLSKKAARIGERLLGYVLVNDKENDKLDIFVSIDNKDKSAFTKSEYNIPKNPNAGKDAPFAFYWTIPLETSTGVHQIYFLVKDSEGIESEVYGPKALVITA